MPAEPDASLLESLYSRQLAALHPGPCPHEKPTEHGRTSSLTRTTTCGNSIHSEGDLAAGALRQLRSRDSCSCKHHSAKKGTDATDGKNGREPSRERPESLRRGKGSTSPRYQRRWRSPSVKLDRELCFKYKKAPRRRIMGSYSIYQFQERTLHIRNDMFTPSSRWRRSSNPRVDKQ